MNANKVFAILLIIGGLLGAAYGGFSYTKDTHQANIASLSFKLTEKEHISVPLWASIAAIIAGGVILVTARKP